MRACILQKPIRLGFEYQVPMHPECDPVWPGVQELLKVPYSVAHALLVWLGSSLRIALSHSQTLMRRSWQLHCLILRHSCTGAGSCHFILRHSCTGAGSCRLILRHSCTGAGSCRLILRHSCAGAGSCRPHTRQSTLPSHCPGNLLVFGHRELVRLQLLQGNGTRMAGERDQNGRGTGPEWQGNGTRMAGEWDQNGRGTGPEW